MLNDHLERGELKSLFIVACVYAIEACITCELTGEILDF